MPIPVCAIVFATTATISNPVPVTQVRLDNEHQTPGNVGLLHQPLDTTGALANVWLAARTVIDPENPFEFTASGQLGSIYYDNEGAGVQDSGGSGSKGISGGGGHQNEEIAFAFIGGAMADSIAIGLVDYKPGTGLGKDDDTALYVTLDSGDILTLLEMDFASAYVDQGSETGYVDFSQIAALHGTVVDSVAVRETNGHLYVNSLAFASVPAPGALALMGLGALSRRRRRA